MEWNEMRRELWGGAGGRRRRRGWLVGWVSPRGPREGEEDGSTSAPPAEKLDRGSAFCFGEREKKRESPQQHRGAYFSRWRGFVQKAGGGFLLIQSAISPPPQNHTHSYAHSAHLPTCDLTCNAREKKFSLRGGEAAAWVNLNITRASAKKVKMSSDVLMHVLWKCDLLEIRGDLWADG